MAMRGIKGHQSVQDPNSSRCHHIMGNITMVALIPEVSVVSNSQEGAEWGNHGMQSLRWHTYLGCHTDRDSTQRECYWIQIRPHRAQRDEKCTRTKHQFITDRKAENFSLYKLSNWEIKDGPIKWYFNRNSSTYLSRSAMLFHGFISWKERTE